MPVLERTAHHCVIRLSSLRRPLEAKEREAGNPGPRSSPEKHLERFTLGNICCGGEVDSGQ